MPSQQLKMILLAFVIIFTCSELAKAETKVIRLIVQHSSRDGTVSLVNDKDLVIKLLLLGLLEKPNHSVAHKNGYLPNYNPLVKDGYSYGSGGFSAKTLQSLAG